MRKKKRLSRYDRLNNAVGELETIKDQLEGLGGSDSEKVEAANQLINTIDSGEVESLKDEISEWKDNIEPYFSGTQKYSDLEECESSLESIVSNIESASSTVDEVSEIESRINDLDEAIMEAGNVCFPGMYG